MARFVIVSENYDVYITDDEEKAKEFLESYVVYDTSLPAISLKDSQYKCDPNKFWHPIIISEG